MTKTKETKETSKPTPDCCMCGDHGISHELFICKVCQFRSQHRYCSNLYPKAKSYGVCNWCLLINLNPKTTETTQNISTPSPSYRTLNEDNMKKKGKKGDTTPTPPTPTTTDRNIHGSPKDKLGNRLRLQPDSPMKKQRSPELSPASSAQKRVTPDGGGGRIKRQVFRNYKVRRYKMLDEVSGR